MPSFTLLKQSFKRSSEKHSKDKDKPSVAAIEIIPEQPSRPQSVDLAPISPRHPLAWRETRPGRWERPLSCFEKIALTNRNVTGALDRDNWAKTAVAKLSFSPSLGDPEQALRTAWKQVRYNYPEIAAFPYNGMYMYRIGNPDQVALWVTATFSVAENTTVDELLGHIPRNEQMMCYWLPKTSEVLIRSPHYRLDARGAVRCLNYFIESLGRLDFELIFGGCAKNLSPSIELALDIPTGSTLEIEQVAEKRLAALESHHPPLELTPQIKTKTPNGTYRTFVKLTKRETQAVMSACQNAGMALPATIHAALVSAVAKLAPPTEVQSYMASFHCDLRNLITKEVTTKVAPTSCTSVLTTEVEVSPSWTFANIYKQLAPAWKTGYSPYLESTACFHEKFTETLYTDGRSKSSEEADGAPQPRFGSLGNIDEKLVKEVGNGLVRVEDFWLGAETLTMRNMVHTWIFEDQIVISCCFNGSFWDHDFVALFVAKIKETLIEEVALGNMMKGLAL